MLSNYATDKASLNNMSEIISFHDTYYKNYYLLGCYSEHFGTKARYWNFAEIYCLNLNVTGNTYITYTHFSTLKVEELGSFESLVQIYKTTWNLIPEKFNYKQL
jgi:hypothetical protein